MSEETNGAAGLVAEIARLRTELQHARAAEQEDARLMAWGATEIENLRAALRAYVHAQRRMLEKWADGDAAVKQRLWQDLHACEEPAAAVLDISLGDSEIARLRRLLDLAHAENATLRDAHAAALAWLETRGADLPKAWRDELEEALHVPTRT